MLFWWWWWCESTRKGHQSQPLFFPMKTPKPSAPNPRAAGRGFAQHLLAFGLAPEVQNHLYNSFQQVDPEIGCKKWWFLRRKIAWFYRKWWCYSEKGDVTKGKGWFYKGKNGGFTKEQFWLYEGKLRDFARENGDVTRERGTIWPRNTWCEFTGENLGIWGFPARHGGTASHHPFWIGIFPERNHATSLLVPTIGVHLFQETSKCWFGEGKWWIQWGKWGFI